MHKSLVPFAFTLLIALAARPGFAGTDASSLLESAPLRFEQSGKGPDGQRFLVRGLRYRAAISPDSLALQSEAGTMALRFGGASRQAVLKPGKALQTETNLFLGKDRAQWRTGVPNFRELRAESLYRGISLRYHGKAGQLEYDFEVAPNADPSQIRLEFSGVQPVIDAAGNLTSSFMQKRPVAYQVADGRRVGVPSSYVRKGDGSFGIRLGSYDRSKEVVIDPVLTFAAYVAGTGQDVAYGIGRDSQGFLYVAGTTAATDLTAVGDAYKAANAGSYDLFVAKLDPTPQVDNPVLYVTYIGGANADNLKAMAVSPAGLVYLAGVTASTDFPMAGNSAQTTLSGTTDAFVSVLDPSQPSGAALIYSSYFGGTKDDTAYSIAYDSNGRVYVAGDTNSADLPVSNAFSSSLSGTEDMFAIVIDPGQATPVYATYLGGGSTEYARGIAVLADGSFWLTGGTYSSDFPLAGNPYAVNYNANCDAFLVRIDPALGAGSLVYSSFFGGSGQDIGETLSIDAGGRLLMSGLTTSNDFPVTATAMQRAYGGAMDAFVAIFDPTTAGQLSYATYYGGNSTELPTAMRVDALGMIHLAGYTASPNLRVTSDAAQPRSTGGYDGFYVKLNPAVAGPAGMDYATYIGGPGTQIVYGIEVDTNSNIFVAGYTSSGIFDALGGPSKPKASGDIDGFVMGLSPCSYSLSASANGFPAAGGTFHLVVTGGKDCTWTVANPLGWLTVTGAPAAGQSVSASQTTLVLQAAPNMDGTARTGTLVVAGLPFLVSQ